MTVELVLFERARQALAEAKTVDEIKAVRDRALALQLYAKVAGDRRLIWDATDIRMNAERKGGAKLREMKQKGERRVPEDSGNISLPALKDLGITKIDSSRWQKLSEVADEDWVKRVAAAQKRALDAIDMTPEEKSEAKKQRRAAHEEAITHQILALPTKQFGVILADPEWKFVPWNEETGNDRSAANHYATSRLGEIKARDVPSIAADNCVLALWATVPMLPQALEVMEAWGFEYRSHCVWLKSRIATGYWFRNAHELLLIGVKGEVPAPAPGMQWESAFDGDVREHSEKPEEAYQMLEQYFPTLPKIELNARKRRDGWEVWGAEAPVESEEAAQ